VSPSDLAEADAWVRSHVTIDTPLELFQVEPWASVARAQGPRGPVWFKACAVRQAFEVPLTTALSSRWSCVTPVLAHDVDRRWLLMADAGEPVRVLGNPPERWLEILPRYAELQVGEVAHVDGHLADGVPDLRLAVLPRRYDELLATDLPLTTEERSELEAFPLARWCAELADGSVADSVQHDDLHMNNVYARDDRLRVLDWGDASIGHPFFSLFETFRFLEELNGLAPDDAWFDRLRDAYLEPFGGDRRELFALATRVSGLAHAVAWLHQREALPPTERPTFDDVFAVVLRRALRLARAA
jgi:hypothetical protein